MTGLTARMQDALRTGYLMAFPVQEDPAFDMWAVVAQAESFPLVTVTPQPEGVAVVVQRNGEEDSDAMIGEVRSVMAAFRKTHRSGHVLVGPDGESVGLRKLTVRDADQLASQLARMKGHTFPIEGYAEILAALRKREAS